MRGADDCCDVMAKPLLISEPGADKAAGAAILALATAVPEHIVEQSAVAAQAQTFFGGRFGDFERVAGVFATTGIRKRHVIRPVDWYLRTLGWPERTAAYLDGAMQLFITAAEAALTRADCQASDVDTIVTVSSTGIATPSLEARVAERMGFRRDVERVPIFGLGCAGGVSGLSVAARLAEAQKGRTILFVAVEICSAAFRLDHLTKANIVATALFADGAAAAVLRAGGATGLGTIEGAAQYSWPGTLDIMGWNVDQQGFGVIFDRSIPAFAERHFGPAVAAILKKAGVERTLLDRFACHPGGSKVIVALEKALHLEQGSLAHEREVLAEYGNMSAPTVFFVLERLIAEGLGERTLMTALGPGFTASGLALRRAA
jgi:alkylresorcinol/alkylpyrone synthase